MDSSTDTVDRLAISNGLDWDDAGLAKMLDDADDLKHVRDLFEYPKMGQIPFVNLDTESPEEDCVYLAGNSLGLMPKGVRHSLDRMTSQWAALGVYGHHYGDDPWMVCDEPLLPSMCRLVGGSTDEVAIMNQLTSSLHFLLVSFYRPQGPRRKILFEDKPFPSDYYAFESQARLHGLDPADVLVPVQARPGEHLLRLEDILGAIAQHHDELSLVCFSGVQYYTGQCFDIATITEHGHRAGAFVGWDLAHSVGNVELRLHDWNVDFAVWTSYKYLNAGVGTAAGAFLHSRLFDTDLPRLNGWWGHDVGTRMLMTNQMQPAVGIRKYRVSNPSGLHCAAIRASLDIFDMVGMAAIRRKSITLTGYFEKLLHLINERSGRRLVTVITPSSTNERGAQLSVCFPHTDVEQLHQALKARGVVCDLRKPDVIRMALCPLYNSFSDALRAFKALSQILDTSPSPQGAPRPQ